ncbi:hypothetical protein AVEN_267853-1, partial [Araneus ventricosus]
NIHEYLSLKPLDFKEERKIHLKRSEEPSAIQTRINDSHPKEASLHFSYSNYWNEGIMTSWWLNNKTPNFKSAVRIPVCATLRKKYRERSASALCAAPRSALTLSPSDRERIDSRAAKRDTKFFRLAGTKKRERIFPDRLVFGSLELFSPTRNANKAAISGRSSPLFMTAPVSKKCCRNTL